MFHLCRVAVISKYKPWGWFKLWWDLSDEKGIAHRMYVEIPLISSISHLKFIHAKPWSLELSWADVNAWDYITSLQPFDSILCFLFLPGLSHRIIAFFLCCPFYSAIICEWTNSSIILDGTGRTGGAPRRVGGRWAVANWNSYPTFFKESTL